MELVVQEFNKKPKKYRTQLRPVTFNYKNKYGTNLRYGLIAQEVSLYPDYDATHIQTFSWGIHGNKLDFSKWKEQNINTLKQLLIRLPNLEWHSEELLVVLGKLNINNIFDIFYGRMEYDEKRNKKRKNVLDYSDRYDAIPYDINPDLKKFVSTHPDTPAILQ